MSDPASLEVAIELRGMDKHEATAVLLAVEPGRSINVSVTKPALGGRRYRVSSEHLSVSDVGLIVRAVTAHHEAVSRMSIESAGADT